MPTSRLEALRRRHGHHHHGQVLWANLHMLFWLSLFPFTTAWMDESGLAQTPVVAYGLNLLAAAIAYLLMQAVIIRGQGPDPALRRAIGRDVKGKASLALYLAGVLSALLGGAHQAVWSYLGVACFVVAAILWLVPDRRIERSIGAEPGTD